MRSPRPRRGGFTLVELLAVIVILGMLIGLIAPSVQAIRKIFLADQTKAYMHQLSGGIDNYRTEIGDLPPSDGSYPRPGSLSQNLSSGAAGLVQCLMGYMGSDKDGLDGPGFRVQRAGRKHGPFVPQQMPIAGDPPVFQDAFGNSILYYRFSTAGKSYNISDNNIKNDKTDAKGPPDIMAYVTDPSPGDNAHRYYREDYILLSPGANRDWDTVTSTTTKTDDIANFSFHLKEIQP
jgi:prepilin-type N-terminal cleavage/methylation domain-containing protein